MVAIRTNNHELFPLYQFHHKESGYKTTALLRSIADIKQPFLLPVYADLPLSQFYFGTRLTVIWLSPGLSKNKQMVWERRSH
jgi:hypothetical protein